MRFSIPICASSAATTPCAKPCAPPHATLRAGTPLSVLLSVLMGGPAEAGTPKASTVLRHLQRRGGRPVDLHTDDRRRLQISLHRPETGDAVLRVSDVTRSRLLQAHIDRQAALLRLVGEAQTSFLMGGDHPRAFSRFLDGLLRIARCHAGLIAAVHGEDRTPGTLAASGAWIEAIAGPQPPVLRRALETAAIAHGEDEADAPGLGHTVILPVGARDRMIGLVALSDRAAPFDDELVGDLVQTLSTVAAMLSIHTVERHRAQTARDLRASQERVRAVFDTIQEGVVIVAANGAITGFNAAAERLFGHPLREVLGRHVNLLSPEGTLSLFDVRTPREAKAGTEARRHEILARRRDGRTFPAEVSISRVDVDQDPLFIAIVQDITDRKRVERLKTELVTTVGHDLRTPLTSILGALGLINSGSLPPEKTKDLLAIAERNGRRLLRLITDLLDLERINAGMIAFDPRPTDLGMVLRQSVETHRMLSEAKNLSVVWALPQRPLRVMGDADRLTQVVINIFGNAVRFSPEGGTIEIRAHADQGRIRVEIADHGPGIPPSFLPVMFDRFRQLETRVRGTVNPGPEGSGLGLSIVRALVELHGGTVGAASPPGGAPWSISICRMKRLQIRDLALCHPSLVR